MAVFLARCHLVLRDLPFLNEQRARGYTLILFSIVFSVAAVAILFSTNGGLDPSGKPLGTDFTSFWAASAQAFSHPADVYDMARHHAAEIAIRSADHGYWYYFYPPMFLIICLPLALLPYEASLLVWLLATGALYLAALRRLAGKTVGVLPLLAFPAVFSTLGHGQNSFLSTALLAVAAMTSGARPVLAGICFGLLVFKPQLGPMIPLLLIASGNWRALIAAIVTGSAFAALSLALFGWETWLGFFGQSEVARNALEMNLIGNEKMQSTFAALRLLGSSIHLAYAAQGLMTMLAAASVIWIGRKKADPMAKASVLMVAVSLASPFILDYDLLLLSIPLAWACRQGIERGFLPYEKIILLVAFLLPGFARVLAMSTGIPVSPLVEVALLYITLKRAVLPLAVQPTSTDSASAKGTSSTVMPCEA